MNLFEIQARLHALGIYTGRVDGMTGPQTKAAIRAFQRVNGLVDDGIAGPKTIAALSVGDIPERIAEPPAKVPAGQSFAKQWPRQKDVSAFFGPPGSHACTAGVVALPYPMRIAWDKSKQINSFRCHEKVAGAFQSIFEKALAEYGHDNIKRLGLDLFGGCYNFRKMRGGNAYSMHSWGIAIDLDPERNQLKWGSDRATFAQPEYQAFWSIVEGHGMISLGRLRNYDWMHFQAARL